MSSFGAVLFHNEKVQKDRELFCFELYIPVNIHMNLRTDAKASQEETTTILVQDNISNLNLMTFSHCLQRD